MSKLGGFRRGLAWAMAFVSFLSACSGCTRRYYRQAADAEVSEVLREKDIFGFWKIENMHVYPNPLARFADPTKPDRPPMPPDDPAARFLGPNPQGPGHAGTERIEGTGYLDLLAEWDMENRAERAAKGRAEPTVKDKLRAVAFAQERSKPAWPPAPEPTDGAPNSKSKPYLLRLEQAMELALINSREFQTRREDLYLTALPVTRERFGFAAQYFAIGQIAREKTGKAFAAGEGNRWTYPSAAGVTKLFSTGALLLAGFANQTVVELGNPTKQRVTSASSVNLDFIQPLLRGGGKAVALEPLTQAERELLYNIRAYARYRKQFYLYLIGGGDFFGAPGTVNGIGSLASSHPLLGTLAGANPARQQVVPAGLGAVGGTATTGELNLAVNPIAPSEGFLPALFKGSIVRYQEANVRALEKVLRLYESYEEGGQVSPLQVGQVQLQLLQGQSTVLQREQDKNTALDIFRAQLGIPINVPLELDDERVAKITNHMARYDKVLEDYDATVALLDDLYLREDPAKMRAALVEILDKSPLTASADAFRADFEKVWMKWRGYDDKTINNRLFEEGAKKRNLLNEKTDLESKEPLTPADTKRLGALPDLLRVVESELAAGKLEKTLRAYQQAPWLKEKDERVRLKDKSSSWRDLRNAFVLVLEDANGQRFKVLRPAWATLDPVVVDGYDVVNSETEAAYDVVTKAALENRLDLMNARAQLVDSWRQVRVFANSLLGAFNVAYHIDSSTPPNAATPLAFQNSRTRHQLSMNFDIPLVRLTERNAYRASLIAYQRTRRDLMQKEDEIVAQVRADIRQLQVLAKNFRIQVQAVELAYQQVESSLATFRAPQVPDNSPNAAANAAGNAASLTNQLLQAYGRLPNAQELVLQTWINYQIARQQLYLNIELMPLDARGVWIDEFANHTSGRESPEFERDGFLPPYKTPRP